MYDVVISKQSSTEEHQQPLNVTGFIFERSTRCSHRKRCV